MRRIALIKIVGEHCEGFTKGKTYELCNSGNVIFVNSEIGKEISDYWDIVLNDRKSGYIEGMKGNIQFEVVEEMRDIYSGFGNITLQEFIDEMDRK